MIGIHSSQHFGILRIGEWYRAIPVRLKVMSSTKNLPALQVDDTGVPNSQQQNRSSRVARLSSTASSSNIFRSLSGVYPSTTYLDIASTAGIQVIRPDTHPEAFVPVPPDGGWGWVVVFAAFFTNLIIDGIYVSFGIMVTDLVDHFNSTVATVMLMGSLLLGVYQIVGPVAAGMVNRFGCRAVGMFGAVLATLSMFISAFMPNIECMIVSYGIFAGAAFGFLHLPSIVCVSFYFDSKRALAIGITSCGTPIGAMIFAPLTGILMNKFGWSNTLILFAGMLFQCAVFAALYRPLTPALVLTPMKPTEAQAIKSLLLLDASEQAPAAVSPAGEGQTLLVPISSQHKLLVPEEGKSDGPMEKKVSQIPLTTISEGPEGEGEPEQSKEPEKKPRHHRHHRVRKSKKPTFKQQIQQQYALWLNGIRLLRSFSQRDEAEPDVEPDADTSSNGGESNVSSDVSTCGSSCDEEASHFCSDSEDEGVNKENDDELCPLKKTSKTRKLVDGGDGPHAHKTTGRGGASRRSISAVECIRSTSSLNPRLRIPRPSQVTRRRTHASECYPTRDYVRPIPKHSAFYLATASAPRNRSVSAAYDQVTQSRLSAFGSALFPPSTVRPGASATDIRSVEELVESGAPVIVELPHESISVEDYSRPLYRTDIFFPGSVKRKISKTAAQVAATASNADENPDNRGISPQSPLGGGVGIPDGIRNRKVSMGTSVFGSSINFGENVPLPPINEVPVLENGSPIDENWTGSCMMSLTRIPLPDVFNEKKSKSELSEEEEAKIWDRLKADTHINLSDKPADGIYHVPRSHSLCGWWLCWKTERKQPEDDEESDEMEHFKRSLFVGDKPEVSRKPRLVLVRRCTSLPKSMFDVLVAMMNLSLLKSFSFAMYCLASLIAVLGMYVPLFFVCDLADSFDIPKSQSAYLLTAYGAASVLSRLASSWVAGLPNVSSTLLSAVTMLLAAVVVCAMPYWGSLVGQMVLMIVYGIVISPFFSLTSIILCDILDLEALTNAYGIVVMVRGIASTVGSPAAGMIVVATSTYSVALLVSGATIVIGALLYLVILFHERTKLKKLTAKERGDAKGNV
nr:monocarboxylate transporter [Hymenolepis microstoma]